MFDVLVMKDYGNSILNRIISITLKEGAENNNAKQMAKDATVAAEIYKLLANEQYGNILYRAAIHLTIYKRLGYDISRQTKNNSGLL